MDKVLVDRELLPCPFCGQQDAFVEQLDSDASVVICQGMVDEHSACLARGPVGVQQSDLEDQPGRDAAIAEWNRRAQPARPQDQREADRDFERYADECSITPNDPVVLRRDQANAYMASMKLLKLEDREYLPDAIRQLQSNYAAAVKGRANFRAALREARATRPEQTEQQATVKHSLTVQPVAYAVFAENGNVVCFSTRRDHPSLVALESEGKSAVPLAPIAQTAPQPEQSELVEALHRVKLTDEEARHHSVSAVAYWNNAVTACIAALSPQGVVSG